MESKNVSFPPQGLAGLPLEEVKSLPSTKRSKERNWIVWGLILLASILPVLYVGLEYYQTPYRSLHPFPAANYLQDEKSFAGGVFSAHLEVVAWLGSKEGVGRLYVFRTKEGGESLPVLVPIKYAALPLFKDESYFVALHINDQGVIYADYFSKD